MLRRAQLWVVFTCLLSGYYAQAKGLRVEATERSIDIHNDTKFTIVAAQYGETSLPSIGGGEVHRLSYSEGVLSGGRFLVSEWRGALAALSQHSSRLHLMTAGVYPDVLQPGLAGDPLSSANIHALTQYSGPTIVCSSEYSVTCLGLLAHASAHLPIQQLEYLLQTVPPESELGDYPPNFGDLPPLLNSIRDAFERWGPTEIQKITVPTPWLHDRGITSTLLLGVLKIKTPSGFLTQRIAKDFEGAYRAILSAYETGNDRAAAEWALEAWRLRSDRDILPEQHRIICSGFDAGAALHQRAERFVAAFGYLSLLSAYCDDTPSQRERYADWFSIQGRAAFSELRLEAARVLFERAYFFDSSPKTEAELADTLAELAILRFREGEVEIARTYLAKASRIAAFRPKVLAAQDADPGGNKRAKIGIVIIIGFLAFFAIRKLRRAWFGDLSGRRRRG